MRIETKNDQGYTRKGARCGSADPRGKFHARQGKCCYILFTAAVVWILCALADDSLGLLDWLDGDVSGFVVFSLLRGFAPIIGSGFFILILVVLHFVLLCSVEKILASENNSAWDASKPRQKYFIAWNFSIPVGTYYLSLKEHSPPAVSLFLI